MTNTLKLSQYGYYYLLTFADAAHTVPAIEPMVFIGIDVLPEGGADKEEKFWFQDPVSFARFGDAMKYSGSEDLAEEGCYLRSYPKSALGVDVHDLDGVLAAVSDAKQRASTR